MCGVRVCGCGDLTLALIITQVIIVRLVTWRLECLKVKIYCHTGQNSHVCIIPVSHLADIVP